MNSEHLFKGDTDSQAQGPLSAESSNNPEMIPKYTFDISNAAGNLQLSNVQRYEFRLDKVPPAIIHRSS